MCYISYGQNLPQRIKQNKTCCANKRVHKVLVGSVRNECSLQMVWICVNSRFAVTATSLLRMCKTSFILISELITVNIILLESKRELKAVQMYFAVGKIYQKLNRRRITICIAPEPHVLAT